MESISLVKSNNDDKTGKWVPVHDTIELNKFKKEQKVVNKTNSPNRSSHYRRNSENNHIKENNNQNNSNSSPPIMMPRTASLHTLNLNNMNQNYNSDLNNIGRTESFLTLNRNLERQVRRLQRDVNFLYNKLNTFEEVNARWGLRYTRRMAIMSNLVMGVWVFVWKSFSFLRNKRGEIVKAALNIPTLNVATWVWRNVKNENARDLLYDAYMQGMKTSFLFFLFSLLLTRKRSWNRIVATCGSLFYSVFLIVNPSTIGLPWTTNFFNIICERSFVRCIHARNENQLSVFSVFSSFDS
eukprot:TRINITY_DN9584_c0_g1_i1.p1 TRINITY_DN9584_c0_g1~~TRINITY_DN9584_c0_g1_i1.p1  ORF type:complete len:297 (-),score=54.26 TRINITY_DN9584_c0_g1_i1:139-1029(-)